jgi:hypothetical protein
MASRAGGRRAPTIKALEAEKAPKRSRAGPEAEAEEVKRSRNRAKLRQQQQQQQQQQRLHIHFLIEKYSQHQFTQKDCVAFYVDFCP